MHDEGIDEVKQWNIMHTSVCNNDGIEVMKL